MKRFRALTAAAACIVLSVNAAAYGIYCENAIANSAMSEYKEDLLLAAAVREDSETSESSDSEKQVEEIYLAFTQELAESEYSLAGKFIDYDVLLQKLTLAYSQYKQLCAQYDELSSEYLVGACTKGELDSCDKSKSDKYAQIRALLFEISALKQEIESATGETLTSDFDFSQCYLITDALTLSVEELSAYGTAGTIHRKDGFEYKNADLTKPYNEAVKAYYALGEQLRLYVSAAQDYQNAQSEFKLGTLSAAELDALNSAFESARISALEGKAAYAKALLALDRESGGALTANVGISGGMYRALDSALPEELKGSGLWYVRTNGSKIIFSPQLLPISFDPEKDSGEYELRCSNKTLFKAPIGQDGAFDADVDIGECTTAEAVFRINGKTARFLVDVNSPFGEFVEE